MLTRMQVERFVDESLCEWINGKPRWKAHVEALDISKAVMALYDKLIAHLGEKASAAGNEAGSVGTTGATTGTCDERQRDSEGKPDTRDNQRAEVGRHAAVVKPQRHGGTAPTAEVPEPHPAVLPAEVVSAIAETNWYFSANAAIPCYRTPKAVEAERAAWQHALAERERERDEWRVRALRAEE